MSERTLVDYVLRNMRRRWEGAVKHADGFTEGVSDLSAWMPGVGTVWVELKALDRWPARVQALVRLDYTDAQREFTRIRRGWVFLRVGREYLLFDWAGATGALDTPASTQALLRHAAVRLWKNSVQWQEFASCLSSSS